MATESAAKHVSLSAFLSVATALTAVGAVALHFLGEVTHRFYLNAWGIDAEMFPKSADKLLINGYYILFGQSVAALRGIYENLLMFGGVAIGLGVYVFILTSPVVSLNALAPAWLSSWPAWSRRLIRTVSLTALGVWLLPFALFLLMALMVVPAAMGENAARSAAKRDRAEFAHGCVDGRKVVCVELRNAKGAVVQGFLLDSSMTHLAIFDTEAKRARVIERSGTELLTRGVPAIAN